MKKLGIQTAILLGLLLVVELGLWLAGHRAGVFSKSFNPVEKVIHEPRHWSCALGINRYIQGSPHLPKGYVINSAGFRNDFEFEKGIIDSLKAEKNATSVMLVGDSYVEGCCTDIISNSFADKLKNERDLLLLNFGVGATDLTQYRLVVEEYAPKLKPDLVVVALYLGNDIMHFARPARPFVPTTFPIRDCGWLPSELPDVLATERDFVSTYQESYDLFYQEFTLKGPNRSFLEKVCRQSIILTKIYIGIRLTKHKRASQKESKNHTYPNLKRIKATCDKHQIPLVFVGIPAPMDAADQVGKETYAYLFKEMAWHYPAIAHFSLADYDGRTTGNHFNNSGHKKYYDFLKEVIADRRQ